MADTFPSHIQLGSRYGVYRSAIRHWVKSAPDFPDQIVLSPGCTRWELAQIEICELQRESVE